MQRDDYFVPYIAEYGFCKPFDRDAADIQVQVVLRAIKLIRFSKMIPLHSGTIRYIMMPLSFQTQYVETPYQLVAL